MKKVELDLMYTIILNHILSLDDYNQLMYLVFHLWNLEVQHHSKIIIVIIIVIIIAITASIY